MRKYDITVLFIILSAIVITMLSCNPSLPQKIETNTPAETVAPTETILPGDLYPFEHNIGDLLYEELNDCYKPGTVVSVKISVVCDLGCLVFVNGERIKQNIEQSTSEYWQYDFVMPGRDTTLVLKSYDGFLQYKDEGLIIETYLTENIDETGVTLHNYYGEFSSGAVVVLMKPTASHGNRETETVNGLEFIYPDSDKISVFYNLDFLTLTESFERDLISADELISIYTKHSCEFYPELYS